jgi:membrane-bound lytic murein transglycosylase D
MNRFLQISILSFLALYPAAGNAFTSRNCAQQSIIQDTIIKEDTTRENQLIEEVINARKIPSKENVQFFNELNKYGFKNLFSNNTYNSSLAYKAQINPNAELFVQDYIKRHSDHLQKMKRWGQPYFNLIESVLQQYGLPKELKYIAVIESNLSTAATSNKGAGGPWQFMPYTARDFGLVVNHFQDERRDYYKSTHAAAKYLLILYRELHDWLLVMAAYNGGPGKVYSAIKKSGSKNFWNLQFYLPEESRTYVKRFIATHYIMEGKGGITTSGNVGSSTDNEAVDANNQTGHLNQNIKIKEPALSAEELLAVEVLPISGKYNSLIIAKNIAMDIAVFNHYNPNFDGTMSSSGNFDLRLPPDKMQLFITNKYPILSESLQALLNGTAIPAEKIIIQKEKKKI